MNLLYNFLESGYNVADRNGDGSSGNKPRSTVTRTSMWLFGMMLMFLTFTSQGLVAQTVTIGSGANVGNKLPVVPYFGFSYSQQVILKSEINTTGNISKLRFYSSGTALANSNNWTIYLGHTSKTAFSNNTDWILSAAMTQVYSGTVTAPAAAGWMEITLTTPFTYNNVDNLVVSVDENATGDAGSSSANYFRIFTPTSNNRAIYYQSDSVNPNPASVTQTGTRVNYLNQMELVFAAPSTTAPDCAISHVPAASAVGVARNPILSWASGGGGAASYDVYFGTSSNPSLVGNQVGLTYNPGTLVANTSYYWKVVPKNANGSATGCVERSFTTGADLNYCNPSSTGNATYISNFSTSLGSTNISNASGYTTGGYQNNYASTAVTSFATGSFNYDFTVVGGTLGAAIWIDWNNSGTFETGERVFATSTYGSGPYTGTIAVPAGTANGDYRMRVMVDYSVSQPIDPCKASSGRMEVEDYKVTVSAPAGCVPPSSLSSSAVASSTATFSWTAAISSPENGYDIYYSTTNTAPDALTTPSVNNHSASPLNATGLSSSSTYYWWVRSDCNTSTSTWAAGGSFTTTQVLATLPYFQNFSGPNGFSFVNGTATNKWVNGSAAGNPANSLYISNDAGISNAYTNTSASTVHAYRDIAIPSGTTIANLSFDWLANGESTYDYLRVWLVPNSYTPTAGTQIVSATGRIQVNGNFNQQTTWQTYTNGMLDLSSFANSTMRLVFEWRNDSSGGNQTPAAVDNISLSIPTCILPTGLVSSNVATTTATLSWTASSSTPSNGYDVYYSTTNTAPDNLTTPSVNNHLGSSLNATGLSSSSVYYWWVRSDCGSETSSWIAGGSFTTLCAVQTAPTAVQGFSTYLPSCWSVAKGALTASSALTSTTSKWASEAGMANAGNNPAVRINLYGGTVSSPNNDWLISNQIDLGPTVGTQRLNFDYAVTSYMNTVSQSTLGTHQLRVVVSTDGGATWSDANVIKTFTGAASYSNTGVTEHIVLNYSGVVKIGFLATTSSNSPDIDFHIDNVSVTINPTDTPDYVNVQFPSTATMSAGDSTTVYAQVYEPGLTDVEPGYSGQAAGIQSWIGVSPVGNNTNPNTWTTWVPATFNAASVGNNDEYMANIGSTLTAGTYYFASRFTLNGGPFVYGGTGGIWNSDSGVLTVEANPTQCAMNAFPANGATNVPTGNLTFTWEAPTSGPAPTSYDIYTIENGSAVLIGNTMTTSISVTISGYNSVFEWQIVPKSAAGGSAIDCAIMTFTTESDPFLPYCSELIFSSSVEPITLVNFAGINNTTSNVIDGTPDMENFTAIVGEVTAGQTYPMVLRGNSDGSFTNNFRVFIDWNQDGDFNDAGETYNAGSIAGSNGIAGPSANSSIQVPEGALGGQTRMRVKKLFGLTNVDDPCSAGGFGQIEDYTLNVTPCEPVIWYADNDGDGFGNPEMTITSCSQPEGYIAVAGDCDDSNAAVNPDATEILYNGIDDNCDGTIDEGNQITTKVKDNQCGTTLASIYTVINANANSQATAYRFKIVDVSNEATQYFVSVTPSFRITDLASYAYGKAYRVSVEIQRAGVWLGYYGEECRISTPAIGALTLKECGMTRNIYSPINAYVVQGATGYKFRVTNVSNPGGQYGVMEIETSVSWFHLTSLPSYEYNTTYSVQVAIKTTGDYTAYGAACDISTLPYSALNLSIKQCGVTYTNRYSSINANVIPNVSGYRFRITNLATSVQQEISSAISWITLDQVSGYAAGASYSVEVAVKTTGDFGAYGPACTINTPAAIASNGTVVNADFKVVASPNPFSDTFALEITEGAAANAEVKVYDMIGKLLEVRSVQSADLSSQRLGNSFPAGVYNVVVTQGDAVRTLKVIKR